MARYHDHFVRRASAAQRRGLGEDALLVHIKVIRANGKCRFKVATDRNHNLPIASNLLERRFFVA